MKKNISILAMTMALWMLLTACGASGAATATTEGTAAAAYDAADYGYTEDYAVEVPVEAYSEETANGSLADLSKGLTQQSTDLSQKLIYTASAQVETLEFEESIQAVNELLERYDAFVEASNITGSNYGDSWSQNHRSASFIIRVPKEHYGNLTSALSAVGNVTYLSSNAENITSQYTDTESRKKALEVEEERLLEILSKAEAVEDMITVESRLSEVRYEKENLMSQLQNWDNQVNYSTVDLYIQEVRELTPEPEEKSYWEQVGEGFMNTLRFLWRSAKGLFRIFVALLPVLVPVAVIICVTVHLTRKKKGNTRKQKRQAEKQAQQNDDQNCDL